MDTMASRCRDFTIAAHSLGYSIVLTETPPPEGRPWLNFTYRCTWRRSGPLGFGEYREMQVSGDSLSRVPEEALMMEIERQLVRPLVGDEIFERVVRAAALLAGNAHRNAVPVEFVGGPKDGDVWTVLADHYGFPEREVLLNPSPELTAFLAGTDTDTAPLPRPLVYRRGVLDETRGVWRYDFVPSGESE